MQYSMKSGLVHAFEKGEAARGTRAQTRRNLTMPYEYTGDTTKSDAFYGDNGKDL